MQLYTKNRNGKNGGVFCHHHILCDSIIEVCPIILLYNKYDSKSSNTTIEQCCFKVGEEKEQVALAFGFGSLYKHQSPSNTIYKIDLENNEMTIIATRNINANEQITINFNQSVKNVF